MACSLSRLVRGPVPFLALALAVGSCAESGLPADHPLARVRFPLFERFEQGCVELLDERERAGKPQTVLTDDVPWATTLDEAFERARREDKPVMIATFVRENGDPHCDV